MNLRLNVDNLPMLASGKTQKKAGLSGNSRVCVKFTPSREYERVTVILSDQLEYVYVCVGLASVELPPSPKFQLITVMLLLGMKLKVDCDAGLVPSISFQVKIESPSIFEKTSPCAFAVFNPENAIKVAIIEILNAFVLLIVCKIYCKYM